MIKEKMIFRILRLLSQNGYRDKEIFVLSLDEMLAIKGLTLANIRFIRHMQIKYENGEIPEIASILGADNEVE